MSLFCKGKISITYIISVLRVNKFKKSDKYAFMFPKKIQDKKCQQERLKCRNTLGCLDQYAAQNSKYARPPMPSQPPTQKVFFQWHTQYDPTMKHSHCEAVYAKELFQWLFFGLVHSLQNI